MAYDVIRKAAALYKNVDVKVFEEDEIVCHCGRITRKQIEDAIINNHLTTVEAIMDATGAGTYCGSCIRPGGHEEKNVYLVDILDAILKKQEKSKSPKPASVPFKDMTVPLKLKALEKALDEFVRPSLSSDSGGVEIIDLQGMDVYIKYTGACAGCASAGRGTLDFIQVSLRDKVDPAINVKPFMG